MSVKSFLKSFFPPIGRDNENVREKWLQEAIKSIPNNSRILDAGAGTQRYRKYCEHLEYVSQDFAQYDGKGDNSALQTGEFDYGKLDIVSDITSIPEQDQSFDAIMCIEVFEHLPVPVKAISEFSRLLKPGGHLILTAPFCSLTHFAPYHFSTGFNKYWYEYHLAEHGFVEISLFKNGNFYQYLAQEVSRIPSMAERYSNSRTNFIDNLIIFALKRILYRLNEKDTGSSELLCFGYHVHAIKNNLP